jgi:hypothetical protein
LGIGYKKAPVTRLAPIFLWERSDPKTFNAVFLCEHFMHQQVLLQQKASHRRTKYGIFFVSEQT